MRGIRTPQPYFVPSLEMRVSEGGEGSEGLDSRLEAAHVWEHSRRGDGKAKS